MLLWLYQLKDAWSDFPLDLPLASVILNIVEICHSVCDRCCIISLQMRAVVMAVSLTILTNVDECHGTT